MNVNSRLIMVAILLLYGLSFIGLGIAILVQPREETQYKLAKIIWLLAIFAIIHGLREWMDLWTTIQGRISFIDNAKPFVLLTSYMLLFEFGRQLILAALPSTANINYYRRFLSGHIYILFIVILSVAISIWSHEFFVTLDIWSRYLFGFIGAAMAGIGFVLYGMYQIRDSFPQSEIRAISIACYLAAAAFVAYSIFGGIIVIHADWFPASRINYEQFLRSTGIPIQLLRTICAVILAVSITYVLRIFHLDSRLKLRYALVNAENSFREIHRLSHYNELLLDSVEEGIFGIDNHGRATFVNQKALKMLGLTIDEILGKSIHALAHHTKVDGSDYPEQECPTLNVLYEGQPIHTDNEIYWRKDGTSFPVEYLSAPIIEQDQKIGAVCIFQDISERIRSEQQLQDSLKATRRANRAMRFLSASNRIMLHVVDEAKLLQDVCNMAVNIGHYRIAWIGFIENGDYKNLRVVSSAGHNHKCLDSITLSWDKNKLWHGPTGTAIRTGKHVLIRDIHYDTIFSYWHNNVPKQEFMSVASFPLIVNGERIGALTIYSDEVDVFDTEEISLLDEVAEDLAFGIAVLRTRRAHEDAERRLIQLAYTDGVTGLPNRTNFIEQLDVILRQGIHGSVFFLDLVQFKEINDTHGHVIGDKLLNAVAQRLLNYCHNNEFLGRVGGDEFALFLRNVDLNTTQNFAERIHEVFSKEFILDELEFFLRTRIGISSFPKDSNDADVLLTHAGLASRYAQDTAHGYCIYNDDIANVLADQVVMAKDLLAALAREEFQLYYQPKVDLASGRLIGAEALVRWFSPTRGMINPDDFISLAEERGLMPALGNWVLEEAIRQLAAWRKNGHLLPGRMAINVSAKQLELPDFIDSITSLLHKYGLSSSTLELEITESVLVGNAEIAIELVRRLCSHGFTLAIDDFGTGFSSLSYLTQFPAQTLKIDRSFVSRMLSNGNDHTVVSMIISMAKSLKMDTIAEGIETIEHAQALVNLGCDGAQGYLFGRPVPANEFYSQWLEKK